MAYANPSRFGPTIQERSLGEEGRQFNQGQNMQLIMAALQAALQQRGQNATDADGARQDRALDLQEELARRKMDQVDTESIMERIKQERLAAQQRLAMAEQRMAPDPLRQRMNTAMSIIEDTSRATSPFDTAGNAWRVGSGGLAALGITSGGRNAGRSERQDENTIRLLGGN